MKRVILFAAVLACGFGLTLSERSSLAETKKSVASAPRAIAVEVLLVTTTSKLTDGQAIQLPGPSDQVAARLHELEANGQIVAIDRIQMTTIEEQEAMFQTGRTMPVVSGRSSSARGGPSQTSYQHMNVGTLVLATAKVERDGIIVEIKVEKTQLQPSPSKSSTDDAIAPQGTGQMTSQTTLLVGNGQTALAGGLDEQANGKSSKQLILVSARQMNNASNTTATPLANQAEEQQIKIFALQQMAASDAANVVKGICDDGSDQLKIGVDARKNALIVSGNKERHLDVIEALLLRLDQGLSHASSPAPKAERKSTAAPAIAKYAKMEKKALQDQLKKLQDDTLAAVRTAAQSRNEAIKAARALEHAPDDKKADLLLRKIEAEVASRKPSERLRRIRLEFDAAERAYVQLLISE